MNPKSFLQRLETLGYYPLPRAHAGSPGYSGLLVVLRQTPHGHEPERIHLRLHGWDGKTTTVHLHADMDQPYSHVVCPGQITIHSRKEREVTFYSFGGSIESDALAGETVYSLRSVAPVLELVPERETLADLLADMTEALFARIEAHQQLSSQQLLERLVKAGPAIVYQAVLESLIPEGDDTPGSHHHAEFIKMIEHERSWYQKTGQWPQTPNDLVTLIQAMGEQ